MTYKPLVFTGCGRSGTGYVARVLTEAGVPCGHEKVFQGYPAPEQQGELHPGVVESSWFAAPFMQGRTLAEVTVVHLVRDPRTWVDSWLRAGAMGSRFVKTYLKRWCPEALREDTPVRAAMRFWLRWNERVERLAALRLSIEELNQYQLGMALNDSGRLGPDDEQLRRALRDVPTNFNTKGGEPSRLEWDDLPFGTLRRGVRLMAEAYGYGEAT